MVQGRAIQAVAESAVPVPRSLKHTFSSHVGLPVVPIDVRVPPAFARALATWLESGSVLVIAAPRGTGSSVVLAAWLRSRPERILWSEGSDVPERREALESVLDGLYELGIITQVERMNFTELQDATDAMASESSPIIMVVNDSELIEELATFSELAELAAQWPTVRWAFITDASVDDGLGAIPGVTLLGEQDMRDPLATLATLSPTDSAGRADCIRDWANQRDTSGDAHRLMLRLSHHLSVRRDSPEFELVADPDAAVSELLESRVIHTFGDGDERRISLVPEFREALSADATAQPTPESIEFHSNAARRSAQSGDDDATIFHLARSGQHVEALLAVAAIPLISLTARGRIMGIRNAAAAIDVNDPGHSVLALTNRLHIALLPPLERDHVRDEIQEALARAQEHAGSTLPPELQAMVTASNVAALVARGRYSEARTLGQELGTSLLALPWLDLRRFGTAPTLVWTGQATAELLEGYVDVASRFAHLAHDSATTAAMPYSLYLATTTLAAVEAHRGELALSKGYLAEAQRTYRQCGWPRSVAQTAELVARYILARDALDVNGMSELRLDISVIPDLSASLVILMKCCECFVYLHSGHATQTRVAVRQLGNLLRDSRPGALLVEFGTEMTFEAIMRAGEPQRAFDYLDEARQRMPDGDCVIPLLAAALVALGNSADALEITDPCIRPGSHHSRAGHSLLLLVRAAAQELSGDTMTADDTFDEALITQHPSPMPYLFLMVPPEIRVALWNRVSEERKREWAELRRFMSTVPETVEKPDESLPPERLTAREMEILRALALGGTLSEIGASQFVSRNTVKSHVRVLYRKLHVSTRIEAIDVMKRFGQQLLESPVHV